MAIRPHILLCAVCQYANDIRPPLAEDNLPELLEMVMQPNCELKARLVPGADWDMCAPCPYRTEAGYCVTGALSCGGLYNEAKDLTVLQALGLTYGTVLDAREACRLIFERIPTAQGVCALTTADLPDIQVWKDGCSSQTFPGAYERGRDLLQHRFR